jgi:Holliday junction resolvase
VKDMVDALKLEEKGEWIFHTEQIKQKNGGFIVKIDYRNKNQLIKMGQLVEKKISRRLEVYSMYRLWFKVEQEFIQV